VANRYFADVSNNNGETIGWTQYSKLGQHVLVALKATEGTGFVDRTHASRSEHAHEAGVWVAHYHFGHPGESASEQASAFWNQVRDHFASKDFAVLDIEISSGLTNAEVVSWCRQFIAAFKATSAGHSVVVYSDESFLEGLVGAGLTWPGRRGWVAAYGPDEPSIDGVSTWAWQFTNGTEGPEPHACAGVGTCDVSTLNEATFKRLSESKPSTASV
jgi:lysozyme